MAMAMQTVGRVAQVVSLARTPVRAPLPSRPVAFRSKLVVRAQACSEKDVQVQATRAVAFGTAATTLLASGNAHAAMEVAQLASDGRAGLLSLLFLPAVAWVLFNIAGPAKSQLDSMKGVSIGLGLTAAGLLAAGSADAATEMAQLAEADGRGSILLLLLLPAAGWVLFNIAGPAINQVNDMKKGLVAGLGLSAAGLLAAGGADAATEVAQLAASDNRLGIVLTLFVPVVGWVLFNIAGPAKNQLDEMK